MTPTNRARMLVLLSAPVVIGIAIAIRPLPRAEDKLAWVILAEIVFLIGVFVNAHRQERHLTWREVLGQILGQIAVVGVTIAIVVGFSMIAAWLYETIRTNWQSLGPILLVVSLCVIALAIALLVLYLAVRVVRAAWKRPIGDSPVTRQELESAVEEILEKRRLHEDDDLDFDA